MRIYLKNIENIIIKKHIYLYQVSKENTLYSAIKHIN